MPGAEHDYVVVGHVTVDVDARTGARKPGGTALYSGLQAARLGCRTLVVTAGDPRELRELLAPFADELDLLVQPRAYTTTFVTTGSELERSQRRIGWAGEIEDPGPIDARIVHIAPVARETGLVRPGGTGFVGVTPQGLLRGWDADGTPDLVKLDPGLMPPRYDALVLDERERLLCEPMVSEVAQAGVAVAVTAAERGVSLLGPGVRLPAFEPTAFVEDLGAGDVFSAAFFIALSEGRDQVAAARLGQAAACLRLAGAGAGAVARREAIGPLAALG
jgi:hypothetical protein